MLSGNSGNLSNQGQPQPPLMNYQADVRVADGQIYAPSAHPFDAHAFEKLCENEHNRYAPNNHLGFVGHAVFAEVDGKKVAYQYQIQSTPAAPQVVQLSNITEVYEYGGTAYRATADNGRVMWAKRFTKGVVDLGEGEEEVEMGYFSAEDDDNKKPFFGSKKETPIFRKDLKRGVQRDLEQEIAENPDAHKGGRELVVDHRSVWEREPVKTRNPSQNDVMGESARDAYENFFTQYKDQLTPEVQFILERAFKADIHGPLSENNYRPEWLHAEGHSLTPTWMDPQTVENLGAAGKWANTRMMVLERVVKWFALNQPESLLSIKPFFTMIMDSEILKDIKFEVRIGLRNRFMRWMQDINPLAKYPLFSKATDMAQTAAVTYKMLNGEQPVSVQPVQTAIQRAVANPNNFNGSPQPTSLSGLARQPRSQPQLPLRQPSQRIAAQRQASQPSVHSQPAQQPQQMPAQRQAARRQAAQGRAAQGQAAQPPVQQAAQQPAQRQPAQAPMQQQPSQFVRQPQADAARMPGSPDRGPNDFPTQFEYEKSVVQTIVTSHVQNWEEPWVNPSLTGSRGSSVVVNLNGKKYLLTNAHCVEEHVLCNVRQANATEEYPARVVSICYQSDLALLEVLDEEFLRNVEAAEIGDMVSVKDSVEVVGFPMGGEEVSISRGIASRIEVRDYSMSGWDGLMVQVDAAVNSGNSGGPVFSRDGKVIGVAFQGYSFHQGLSYIIPTPIIKHFLNDVARGIKPVFPELPIDWQRLDNPHLRKYYQLGPKQTGIRVSKVNQLSDAFSKLKVDDIIIQIDGHDVTYDGKVDIKGIGQRIDFEYLFHRKYLNDSVNVKVLRKDPDGIARIQDLQITLDCGPNETTKVPTEIHDQPPVYYINAGICFVPVTNNYLQAKGSELEEMYFAEEGRTLTEMPKKNHDEEFVVISQVFRGPHTKGYSHYEDEIVKEVNGVVIKNMRELIVAMESNQNEMHVIKAGSRMLVLPNLSRAQNKAILDLYKIDHDRSPQYRNMQPVVQQAAPVQVQAPAAAARVVVQEPVIAPPPTPTYNDDEGFIDFRDEVDDDDENDDDYARFMDLGVDELDEANADDVQDELESDSADLDFDDDEARISDRTAPGVQTFLATVHNIAGRAKRGEFQEELNDDDYRDNRRSRRRDRDEQEESPVVERRRLKKRAVSPTQGRGFFDHQAKPQDQQQDLQSNAVAAPPRKARNNH